MPITQRKGKWFWGGQGPFDSKEKAEEVAQAAHASGYQKVEKIETGAPMDGSGRKPTVTELQRQDRGLEKHYLHPNTEDWAKAPGEHTRGTGPYVDDDPPHQRGKQKPPATPQAHSHKHSHHLHKEDGGTAGSESFGGTVFTSSNAGIFNTTYGEHAKPKKKDKKKSGIERLNDFVTDNSPIKLSKQEWNATGGAGHTGPVRIDWDKRKIDEEDVQQMVEREGHQDDNVVAEQREKDKLVEEIGDDEKLKKEWGWGTAGNQGDPLQRASGKDKLSRNPIDEDEEEGEHTTPEEPKHLTYGKKRVLSKGFDSLFMDLLDEMP